jgi:hypothetical protein
MTMRCSDGSLAAHAIALSYCSWFSTNSTRTSASLRMYCTCSGEEVG